MKALHELDPAIDICIYAKHIPDADSYSVSQICTRHRPRIVVDPRIVAKIVSVASGMARRVLRARICDTSPWFVQLVGVCGCSI